RNTLASETEDVAREDQIFLEENLEHSVEAQMMAGRNAGSQLTFAHGIRKPQGVDLMLLSSAIMTQSNTFGKLTSELADKNDGSVVKKVVLYGNHAYLWSTENGYDFFVEQKLTINEKNYQAINDLLDTYGTDEFTESNIDIIQRSEDKETRSRSLADLAKSTRDRFYNRQSAGAEQTSNRTGVNEYNLSDTQSEENGGVVDNVKLMKGRNGTVYGWCETEYDENGNFVANHIYLNPKTLNSNTMVHELGHLWINLLRAKNKELYDKRPAARGSAMVRQGLPFLLQDKARLP
ncbi:MAG: hypothetical protein II766_02565, partial [Paludibacteraceae bacterium]|nr:hypothetical protein [Paludibacteraceae bacterium]